MSLADFIRQVSILLTLPVVVLMGTAAAFIVVARDWRLVLFAYAIESATLAILLTQRIPVEWALLQAITGGLVAVMLFLSARQLRDLPARGVSREGRWPQLASLTSLRVLALILAVVAFFTIHDRIDLPQASPAVRDGIVWLVLVGILGLALHEEPLHAGLALLTIVGGFLLLFFGLRPSRLLIGVLEAWQLLLGLAIAYLMVSRGLAGPVSFDALSPFRWRV
jgi:hypothetical protein